MNPNNSILQQRVNKVKNIIGEQNDLDAFLLVRDESIINYDLQFLTGFSGSSAFALVTQNSCILFTDMRYVEQATHECNQWEIRLHGRPVTDSISQLVKELDIKKIGFDPTGITVSLLNMISTGIVSAKFVSKPGIVTNIREYKDGFELSAISSAADITDWAFKEILKYLRPGVTESYLASNLENLIKSKGAEGLAFDSIVAAGPNSALPHARPSNRKLCTGDLVVFDFGARVNGYCSDMTRTVVVGRASSEQGKLYEAVLSVQEKSLEFMRIGVKCNDVALKAEESIRARGYGDYPSHSLGHGLGLAIHEAPYLRVGSKDILTTGHVVTVEPGIYIPGSGGVRIEDTVLIGEDGVKVLTKTTKNFLRIG